MIILTDDEKNLIVNNAAIIDDEIYKERTSAKSISDLLSEHGTTFIKERRLPNKEKWKNFLSMSYIILDWDLKDEEINDLPEGVQIGASLFKENKKNNIDFIAHIIDNSLVPIFIITQENTELIKQTLTQKPQINEALKKGNIIVEAKEDVKGEKIIEFLQNWINSNNNIKVLKRFEKNLSTTKNKMFVNMDSIEKNWIDVVKNTIDQDNSEDSKLELSQFITNMFLSRLPCINLDEINFNNEEEISKENLIIIYSATKICAIDENANNAQHLGDIYMKKNENKTFYINVTAECDARKDKMFLVLCEGKNKKKNVNLDKNTIIDIVSRFTIPMLLDKKLVVCELDKVERIDKPNNLNEIEIGENKYTRVGRLTHPYTTALTQKLAQYFSRQGLPTHPMSKLWQDI